MRVLFVCTVPTEKSGIPNVIFNLLNGFNNRDLEIGYVSINDPDPYYKAILKKKNVNLSVIPRRLTHVDRYIRELSKVAKGYDVMHVHGNSATMVLEMIAAKIAGVELRIAHSHNTSCSMRMVDKIMRPLFYHLCNGRIACGKEAGEWLFKKRDFLILNNGIDCEKFRFNESNRSYIRKTLDWDKNKIIGHIGNFVEQKNHEFLIGVFAEIHAKNPNTRLMLLGGGPLQKTIQNKVMDLGLSEEVYFAGSVNNPQKYMSAMDIILMPSLFEGLPLTLVEEQANGLECIVADTITPDADLTDKVQYLSLDAPLSDWMKEVNKRLSSHTVREEQSSIAIDQIRKKGFDISYSSALLIDFYKERLS